MVGGKGGKVTQRMVVEGIVKGSLKVSVEGVLKGLKKGKNRRERQMSDLLESTIRSLPSKLHSVATFTVVQSLLMVPVYLMHTQLEATLSFLEQIPDVSEQSSMVFVLQEWTSCHPSFFGKWETRMSSLAMADLLSHYLSTGDKYLVAIETVSKEVVKPSEGIMTQS